MRGVKTLELSIRREDVLNFLDYPAGRQPPARVLGPLDAAIEEARQLQAARGATRRIPVSQAHLVGLEPVEADALVIGVVTAGPAIEARVAELMAAGDLTRAVLLDAAGSAAAEEAADRIGAQVVGEAGGGAADAATAQVSCRVSPGYGRWTIESQPALLARLPGAEVGVTLTSSFMMVPRKSISFAMWLGANDRPAEGLSGCIRCTLARCRYRRRTPPD